MVKYIGVVLAITAKIARQIQLIAISFLQIPFVVCSILNSRKLDHLTSISLFDVYKRYYLWTRGCSEVLTNLLFRRPFTLSSVSSLRSEAKHLVTYGFVKLEKSFKEEVKDFLINSEGLNFRGRLLGDFVTLKDISSTCESLQGRYDAVTQEIYNNLYFARIVTSSAITQVARSILGEYTVITSALIWASFYCPDFASSSTSAQVFHVDFDFIDDIKLFILLTDTLPNDGALEYIAKSHQPLKHKIFTLSEMDEAKVYASFSKDLFKYFSGSVGDAYLSNNRGIHRDHPPLPGRFKIGLQINFARSRFGSEGFYSSHRPALLKEKPSYNVWKRAIDQNPYLYSLLFKK